MRRYILIGRSGSGKTTILNELKKIGFKTFDEIPRQVIKERNENFFRRAYSEIFKKRESIKRQRIIFERHLKKEEEFEKNKIPALFMERGLIDFIAFTDYLCGFVPDEFYKYNLKDRYSLVFNLENLPFIKDNVRIEKDEKEASMIQEKVIKTYKNFGYTPINIPIKTIEERVNLILDYLEIEPFMRFHMKINNQYFENY